jgi:hypothetical protein
MSLLCTISTKIEEDLSGNPFIIGHRENFMTNNLFIKVNIKLFIFFTI